MAALLLAKEFASAREYLEWATNAPTPWRGGLSSREKGNERWYGTNDYDEAHELAKFGWSEGLEKLAKQVDIAARLSVERSSNVLRRDVAGSRPIPARAAAGDAFSMVSKGKNLKPKPIIRIRTNYVFAARIETQEVTAWGAAVCSYVNELARAGFSVQLDNLLEVTPSDDGGPNISIKYPLKTAGQPLALNDVAFWWMHPSAFRRIGFSAIERLDVERCYRSGYGYPAYEPISPVKDGELCLSIKDAGGSVEKTLANIKAKHQKVLEKHPVPGLDVVKPSP